MTNKKINKKITIEEFKMWLEGLETFQPPNWAPTFEQWRLIRNKIFSLASKEPSRETSPHKMEVKNDRNFTRPVDMEKRPPLNFRQNPSLIPIESDIGDTELIKLPPPVIPRKS